MNALRVFDTLAEAGVRLIPKGDGLRAEARPGVLTTELRRVIADNKPALLALLGDPEGTRDTLLALADSEGAARTPILRLDAGDLAGCAGRDEATLRAYVRALEQSARLARGECPPEWRAPAECVGCGPVWLWEGLPAHVEACPWCQHRAAGVRLPRPPVSCEGCRHFLPDPLNPEAGIGGCGITGKPAHYPTRSHVCATYRGRP